MTRLKGITAAAVAATAMVATAAAAFFAPAPARAGSVVLWACHGPRGEALGAVPFAAITGGDGVATEYGHGCEAPATTGSGGLAVTFSRPDPDGGSLASWELTVPEGVTLDSVRIARTLTGFGETPLQNDPQWYEALTSNTSLQSASLETGTSPFGDELLVSPVEGRFVRVSVGCKLRAIENCASPPNGETVGANVSSIALGALDDTPPTGAVGGVQSPTTTGRLELLLDASDTGLGLANAQASIDESNTTFVRLGTGSCPEHPVIGATIELPLGAACPRSVSNVPLSLDTTGLSDGEHTLRVWVTDAAGNTATLVDQPIVVQNEKPATGTSATVTVGIGSGTTSSTSTATSAPVTAHGGVLGYTASTAPSVACQLPELSMRLASKPLRYAKHHVPVLRARHHYVFKGNMTCLLHDRRVPAPTGTVLRVLYTVKTGRHAYRTYASGRSTMTVHDGKLRAILAYHNSRTIIFRYNPHNGEYAQVKIPIQITHVSGRYRLDSSPRPSALPRRARLPVARRAGHGGARLLPDRTAYRQSGS
jgi:hypothetical protein